MRTTKELEGWIRENEVCFEILPHHEFHRRRKVQVGFELTLFAMPPPALPGGRSGVSGLRRVIRDPPRDRPPRPAPGRPLRDRTHAAFHLRPETHWKTEVELVVELVHLDETFETVDEDDLRHSRQVAEALETLGAQSKVWSARPNTDDAPCHRSVPE